MEMEEVLITFEENGETGWVATGSYLNDAARRMGVTVAGNCSDPETPHECAMWVKQGSEMLSGLTELEIEKRTNGTLKQDDRLACQTKIEKPGELVISWVQKPVIEEKEEKTQEKFRKEFEAMPLSEKVASLVDLEAIALRETFEFVLDAPYIAAERLMDVLAGFGFEMERKDKEANRPKEHVKQESELETRAEEKTSDSHEPKAN